MTNIDADGYKSEFIKFMLGTGCLAFGDFITKSGRKSPFFINAGAYSSGSQLSKLGEFYAKAIYKNFGLGFSCLFGPAYKGIPLAVATAIAFYKLYGKDVVYAANRKEAKDHGEGGAIIGGPVTDSDKIIIIEDVSTSGASIRETMPIIKAQCNAEIIGLIVSIDRMERGKTEKGALLETGDEFGFKAASIATISDVVELLREDGALGDGMLGKMHSYYEEYGLKDNQFWKKWK